LTIDLGLLLLRLLVGIILFVHAGQKWWGWFNGPGMDAMVPVFASLGQHPPRPMIRLAAMAELAGAVLLLTGFLTIYGAALAATTLLVAGLAQCLKAGAVMAAKGGGEYPLALAAVSAAIGLTGAGAYSLDATLGTPLNPGLTWWTVLVCVVAPVLASIPPTLRARALIARGSKDPSGSR